MAESINIPISMIVDDIKINPNALDKMTDHLDQAASAVTKDANKALSSIDPTKMNEAARKSIDLLAKRMTDLNQASRDYGIAQKRAGESSKEFQAAARANTAAIDAEKKSYGELIGSFTTDKLGNQAYQAFQQFGIGGNPFKQTSAMYNYYEVIEQATIRHNEVMAKLTAETPNPLDFVSMGSDEAINGLIKAYERVIEATNNVRAATKTVNEQSSDNRFTDEYNERIATIQKLTEKMEQLNEKSKKMEAVGASDNAWESLRYDMNQVATELTSIIRAAQKLNKSGANMQIGPDATVMQEQTKLLSDMQRKVTALKKTMNGRADKNETPYTKEYADQLREIERVKREIDKLAAKEKEMQALGADRDHWNKLAYDVQVLNDKMDQAVGKAQDLVDAGKAFKFGGDAEAEMARLDEEANTLRYTLNRLENTDPNLKTNFFMTLRSMKAVSQMCDKILGKVKNLWKSFTNLFKHANKGSVSLAGGFKKLLRQIMMFGLGFRSTYYLVKQLRKIVTEELGHMAKAFPEVNKAMSEFKTSLNQLKGQFGAAFLPIFEIVLPALESIISALNRACEAIARFFAILSGKGTYKKFTSDVQDYAESLEGAGGAAEDLKNSVMGFDELNKLNDDSGGGGGGSDAGGSWEDVPAASDFAEMLKQSWANADFTELGGLLGEKLKDALDDAVEKLNTKGQEFAKKLGQSLSTFINGFFDTDSLGTSIGEAIAAGVNVAITGLHTFLAGTDWLQVGTVIGESITTAIDDINWEGLGTTLGDYMRGVIQFAFGIIENIDFDNLGEKIAVGIENFFARMGEVDPTTGLNGWQEAGKSMHDLAKGLLEALIKALDNVDWDAVGEAIGGFLSELNFGDLIIDFGKLVIKIVEGLAEAISGWQETDPLSFAIATMIGTALLGVELTSLAAKAGNLLLPLLNQISQVTGKTFPILSSFTGILKGIGGSLLIISGAFLAVTNAIDMFKNGVTPVNAVLTILGTTLVGVGLAVLGIGGPWSILIGVIAGAVAVIVALIVNNWEEIKAWAVETWGKIKEFFSKAWEFIKTEAETAWSNLKNLFNGIITFFTGPLVIGFTTSINAVIGIFKGLWQSVQEVWNGIKEIFNGIITFVKGVFTGNWSQAWEGVKMIFKGIFDALVGLAKAPINMIIGLINGMLNGISSGVNYVIDKVNGLSFTVPDWVPLLGGKNFGFNLRKMSIANIPYLAQGAVIPPNNEFLAMLGDQKHGTNIEAPLETIVEAVRQAFDGGGAGEINITVVSTLDGREVARNTVKHIKLMERSGAYA